MLSHLLDAHVFARASAAPRQARLNSSIKSKDSLPFDPTRLTDLASSGYRRTARLSLQATLEFLRVALNEIGVQMDCERIPMIIVERLDHEHVGPLQPTAPAARRFRARLLG
ncbi:MAG: hypothetical protein AAF844_03705 [Pseudomonadota bacterium]